MDVAALQDGDLAKNVEVTFGPDSLAWVQSAYAQPTTIRALTVVAAGSGGRGGFGGGSAVGQIQVSDDGTTFRTIGELPRGGAPEQTIALPATTARYFRVLFKQPPPPAGGLAGFGGGQPPQPVRAQRIAELSFTGAARIHRFEDKAGWSHIDGLDAMPTPSVSADLAVAKSNVVDLTSRLRADGTLDWTPPAGTWRVLRLGWSLAGTLNRPGVARGHRPSRWTSSIAITFASYLETYLGPSTRAPLAPEWSASVACATCSPTATRRRPRTGPTG